MAELIRRQQLFTDLPEGMFSHEPSQVPMVKEQISTGTPEYNTINSIPVSSFSFHSPSLAFLPSSSFFFIAG